MNTYRRNINIKIKQRQYLQHFFDPKRPPYSQPTKDTQHLKVIHTDAQN